MPGAILLANNRFSDYTASQNGNRLPRPISSKMAGNGVEYELGGRRPMLLDGTNLNLRDVEAKIAEHLTSVEEVESNAERACQQFEIVLANVLRLLPGNRRSRYWDLDGFSYDSMSRCGGVVTLQGVPYWLSGGDGCDRFRIDVALETKPLLYSYKFTNSMADEQVLYVGKTPEGWHINGP
jgi:hypothetical protein